VLAIELRAPVTRVQPQIPDYIQHRAHMSIEANESEAQTVTATATQRNRQNHRETWPYGNYRSYYSFRAGSTGSTADADQLDGRLALLDPTLFARKTVLDIGTNAGKVALDVVRHLGAGRAVGVDIDPLLIDDANENAAKLAAGVNAHQIDFFEANVMQPGWFDVEREPRLAGIDVVTLFSITKWLHLHNGDAGMRRLFSSLFAFLPPGGVLIVEPQEYANYARAAKKNKDLRETFRSLEMRPPFDAELREVGFGLETRTEREEGGFSRPLLVWRKPGTVE
jgi:7SK snRNA methylphosphate capping enzyme